MSQKTLRRLIRLAMLCAVAVLGLLALLRSLAALLEAATVFLLVLILASIALPHRLGHYWRKIRTQLPDWLEDMAQKVRGNRAQAEEAATGAEKSEG